MKTITYENIEIKGFAFKKIRSVKISHRPNQHGMAVVEGEVDPKDAKDLVDRVDEKKVVKITTKAEGQHKNLFFGFVSNITLRQENEYSIVELKLHTTSIQLDRAKRNKSFQDVTKNYKDIIKDAISEDKGKVDIKISDEQIKHLIMQYEETGWEFAMRIASQRRAPLIADIISDEPSIVIGMPDPKKEDAIESKEHHYVSALEDHARHEDAMVQDFSGVVAESYAYAYIGDKISLNGKAGIIKGVDAVLTDGILCMRYTMMHAGGNVIGSAPPMMYSRAAGKILVGEVRGVKKDKVKVWLESIDKKKKPGEKIDEEKDWLFPFSTVYSSSDGSGWYCMPEKGDKVRIYFPSGNEEDAFAASSVFAQPPKDPRNKVWKAPGGKEILLTDEGLYIIGKSGKVYISLTDDKGVEIYSDEQINVISDTKVNICAADQVHIVAKNEIIIGTEEAYIDIDKSSAVLAAKKVLVN